MFKSHGKFVFKGMHVENMFKSKCDPLASTLNKNGCWQELNMSLNVKYICVAPQ